MLFDNLLSKYLENEKSFSDETNYDTYIHDPMEAQETLEQVEHIEKKKEVKFNHKKNK